jgi:hypothetical protein
MLLFREHKMESIGLFISKTPETPIVFHYCVDV